MTYFTFLQNNLQEFLAFIFLFNVGNVTEIAEEIIRISDIVIMQENKFQSTNGATSKTASKQPSSSEANNCGPHALYLGQNQCLCGDGFDNEKNGTSCIEIKDIDTKQCSDLNCHRGLCQLNKATKKPYCECNDPMYDGEFCDHYICADYCSNGGMCIPIWLPDSNFTSKPAMLKCSCRQGYSGKDVLYNIILYKLYLYNMYLLILRTAQ